MSIIEALKELGLTEKDFNQEKIKKAYRAILKKCHPDYASDKDTVKKLEEKTKRVNIAKDILDDALNKGVKINESAINENSSTDGNVKIIKLKEFMQGYSEQQGKKKYPDNCLIEIKYYLKALGKKYKKVDVVMRNRYDKYVLSASLPKICYGEVIEVSVEGKSISHKIMGNITLKFKLDYNIIVDINLECRNS